MRNTVVCVMCLLLLLGATERQLMPYTVNGRAQGTEYTITYYAEDSLIRKAGVDSVLAVIDRSMSLYKPNSLINYINSGKAGKYVIDKHFSSVLRRSFEIYDDSDGLFDVTVAPLVRLWGFGVDANSQFPDTSNVQEVLRCVGMDNIRLRGRTLIKKKACVQLDFNGVAQGYSVDVIADYVKRRGVKHYMVELGGEIQVEGAKPDGSPMRIGIERLPADGRGTPSVGDVMEVRNGAVTTAGNYRKFRQQEGRRISHHIDPKTGFPLDTEVISATVYAKDAMTADGYDNVFMALNAEEGIAFAAARHNVEVYLIYKDDNGTVKDTLSAGFKQLMEKDK